MQGSVLEIYYTVTEMSETIMAFGVDKSAISSKEFSEII